MAMPPRPAGQQALKDLFAALCIDRRICRVEATSAAALAQSPSQSPALSCSRDSPAAALSLVTSRQIVTVYRRSRVGCLRSRLAISGVPLASPRPSRYLASLQVSRPGAGCALSRPGSSALPPPPTSTACPPSADRAACAGVQASPSAAHPSSGVTAGSRGGQPWAPPAASRTALCRCGGRGGARRGPLPARRGLPACQRAWHMPCSLAPCCRDQAA